MKNFSIKTVAIGIYTWGWLIWMGALFIGVGLLFIFSNTISVVRKTGKIWSKEAIMLKNEEGDF